MSSVYQVSDRNVCVLPIVSTSTRRHPVYSLSVLVLPPREIQARSSQSTTKKQHINTSLDRGMANTPVLIRNTDHLPFCQFEGIWIAAGAFDSIAQFNRHHTLKTVASRGSTTYLPALLPPHQLAARVVLAFEQWRDCGSLLKFNFAHNSSKPTCCISFSRSAETDETSIALSRWLTCWTRYYSEE